MLSQMLNQIFKKLFMLADAAARNEKQLQEFIMQEQLNEGVSLILNLLSCSSGPERKRGNDEGQSTRSEHRASAPVTVGTYDWQGNLKRNLPGYQRNWALP